MHDRSKTLFRPVTVMAPNMALVCENILLSEGFIEAKVLASKVTALYSLAPHVLSRQVRPRCVRSAHPRERGTLAVSEMFKELLQVPQIMPSFGKFSWMLLQDHYDWGLRELKSVLVVAGVRKRMEPGLPEESLLLQVLRDSTMSRIIPSDEVRSARASHSFLSPIGWQP